MYENYSNIYFVGIGGIGMSSLARYFNHKGLLVAGYDRVNTVLTQELENEGIIIHYADNVDAIPDGFKNKDKTLVVYTPAIPITHSELNYFKDNGFNVIKRSSTLGAVSSGKYVMAVAGTHGKTSTTTMLAYFNHEAASEDGCIGSGSAFLGGISKNFNSNLVLGEGRRLVVEADEFDRSFLQLYPDVAVVTSTDADHLDIYGDHDSLKNSFSDFVSQIKKGGALIFRKGIELNITNKDISVYTYSPDDSSADFYAKNISADSVGIYTYDIVCPDRVLEKCTLGIPGLVNVENSLAAVASIWIAGFDENKLRVAMSCFRGVKRRFDVYINTPSLVYIDDYAHHPGELIATINSIRKIYGNRKITAVFQPHLYTRTRDFADGFSKSLSLADRVVLLPIYPAREEPIDGVCSEMLLDNITIKDKEVISKEQLLKNIELSDIDIIITFGAGDIDLFCKPVCEMLSNR